MNDAELLPQLPELLKGYFATWSRQQQEALAGFASLSELAGQSPQSLARRCPGLPRRDARELLEIARGVRIAAARRLREKHLSADQPLMLRQRHGLQALNGGPSWSSCFATDWDNMALPGAPEASNSPIAYLLELFRKALDLEERGEAQQKITLQQRRPDIARQHLDAPTMTTEVSTLGIVIKVLKAAIRRHQADRQESADIDRALAHCLYPLSMPFERWQNQINQTLEFAARGLTQGEVARQVDRQFPYFFRDGVHSPRSDIALLHSSGLGFNQRALLNAPPIGSSEADVDAFVARHFAVKGLQDLARVDSFCLVCELPRLQLDTLFAVQTRAPYRSANVTLAAETVGPEQFGAQFVNGAEAPAISLDSSLEEGADGQPLPIAPHRLVGLNGKRADALSRFIRLSHWLDLPFNDTDRLLMAAIRAEQGPAGAPVITVNTIRALGAFREYRLHHQLDVATFAVWLDQLSPYGLGGEQSQFDQVFNAQSLFPQPLRLDNGHFDLNPQDPQGQLTVQQITAALGLNQESYNYLARVIATAHQRDDLQRSLPILSSFYRLTSLAACLKLHPIVLVALLKALDGDGDGLLRQLAGRPANISYQVFGYADVLGTLMALHGCLRWCRSQQIDVVWLIQHLQAPQVLATDAEKRLCAELDSRLESVRVTLTTLLESGVPVTVRLDSGIELRPDWFALLEALLDEDGIIRDDVIAADQDYPFSARNILEVKIEEVHGERPDQHPQLALAVDALLSVLLQARAAQRAVVQESLADYLRLNSELVLPLTQWAGQTIVQLLSLARRSRLQSGVPAALELGLLADEDDAYGALLLILTRLQRLAQMVGQFRLDAAMLQNHARPWGEQWFGFKAADISLTTVYYLSLYAQVVASSESGAEPVLDYLRLVNDPELFPADMAPSEDQLRLVRDAAAVKIASLLGWSANEVLEACQGLNPQGIAFALTDFDKLLRCLQLSRATGLSVKALQQLGELDPNATDDMARDAAQDAVACLSAAALEVISGPLHELGQSVTSSAQVNPERLIAGLNMVANRATLQLIVRDLRGQPLKGIVVRWTVTGAGSLGQQQSVTDDDGVTQVTLKPGVVMGVARVTARIGLSQDIELPSVLIDCDESSLEIVDHSRDLDLPERLPLAGEKQKVELFVELRDRYDNLGIDRLVRWHTNDGRLLSTDVHTDRSGRAWVQLVSRDAATCQVTARYAKNGQDSTLLPPIRFVDRPAFDRLGYRLRLLSAPVVGTAVQVACRLLTLAGQPVAGQVIDWQVAGVTDGSSQTDAEGIATHTFTASSAATISIRALYGQAQAGDAPESLEQSFNLLSAPALVPLSPLAQVMIASRGDSLAMTVRVDAEQDSEPPATGKQPIMLFPVQWSRTGQAVETFVTDGQGQSHWSLDIGTVGTYGVKAEIATQTLQFSVQVIAAPRWLVYLDEQPIDSQAALNLRQGEHYQLRVLPASGQAQLIGQPVLLTWSGPNVIGLGLRAQPMFGQRQDMSDNGLEWNIHCNGREGAQFALGIRLDDLDHVHWLTVNLLGNGRLGQRQVSNIQGAE